MNKHTATYEGHTFTRSSQNRTYTHCIVRIHNVRNAHKLAVDGAKASWARDLNYYSRCATANVGDVLTFHPNSPRPIVLTVDEDMVKRGTVRMALGEAGLIAQAVKQFEAFLKSAKLINNGTEYLGGGDEWCGRFDLAQKAVAKHQANGVRAVAVTAVVVSTKPKA